MVLYPFTVSPEGASAPRLQTGDGVHGIEEHDASMIENPVETKQTAAASGNDPVARQIADLYASYMDESAVKKRGPAALSEEIRRIDAITGRRGDRHLRQFTSGGDVSGVYRGLRGQALEAATNRYTIRFAPGQLPPVNAFWSLTMYALPSTLLSANPLNRYLLNSAMLPQLEKDGDGGLTLYIQNESPGHDKEANWLPARKGPSSWQCASTGRRPKRWRASGPRRR